MINIGFTGDFCPWGRTEDRFLSGVWKDSFDEIKPFFDENQFNILDMECPLTKSQSKIIKTGPHLKALPETAEIIEYLNCKLVATANNHFKDFGWEGMQQTYSALKKFNIATVGSGSCWSEASKTVLENIEGIKVAFINAADREWSTTDDLNPGCNPLDAVLVYNSIQTAAKTADFVIVIAHGGHEHYNLPSPRIKKLYRFFIDAGASAVIGHHTHIIAAHETYKNAPIFYSLGNFCFDWPGKRNHHWNYGMLVRLKLEPGKPVVFETLYIEQYNKHPMIKPVDVSKEMELKEIQYHLNELIKDDHTLELKFKEYAKSLSPLINTWIEPYTGKLLPSLHKNGLLPGFMGFKKKQLLTVLIQCDTHRDVLLDAIDPRIH